MARRVLCYKSASLIRRFGIKALVLMALALMSFSALASGRSASEVIAGIEEREGVSCAKVD